MTDDTAAPDTPRRSRSRRGRGRHARATYRRRQATAAIVALVVLAAVASLLTSALGGTSGHSPKAAGTSETSSKPGHAAKETAGVFAGPDGPEARWVVAENAKPGSTAWAITPGDDHGIAGYASAIQTSPGQAVTLYVSTAAPTFLVTAYRMGYYGGEGARAVWTSPVTAGSVQPTCPVTPGINMVECSWKPSLSLTVSAAWVPGVYLLKLVGSGDEQSYVPLTVMDPASRATYLVQNSVLTWQAWNTYGGYDLYGGGPPGQTPTYDARARVVSFDRPYATGDGASDFLGEEYPLIRFMEEHGLDVTYGTDITTGENPASLLAHRVFLSLGHDEQWSLEMRNAATTALDHGVNLVFFGASPVLRKVRLQPSPLGPDREMVNYRDPTADPVYTSDPSQVSQNQWIQPPANWSPSALVGNSYLGYGVSGPLVVSEASSWLYAGTGLKDSDQLPGVIEADFNGYVPGPSDPAGVEILAHSPATPAVGTKGYADTVYYTLPGGGGVFSTGTNGWIPAMACTGGLPTCAAPDLASMTGNLLRLFGSGPAGATTPSTATWQSFYPSSR